MSEILKIENLTIKFGSFTAVDNISLSVNKGEIFGFLGANGAGKTTTIRAICGLINITSGTISADGQIAGQNLSRLKKRIAYMSQKSTLYQDLTVKENIVFSASLYNINKKTAEEKMKVLLSYAGFNENENEIVKNLSGGSKQTVSLCCCLLHEPDIIFLDEPTAGASPISRFLFWKLIKKLAQEGKTIFVTTHYMDEAEYCFRIALMHAGKLIAINTPLKLKEETKCSNLDDAFAEIIKGAERDKSFKI